MNQWCDMSMGHASASVSDSMASQVALSAAVMQLGRVGVEEKFFPCQRSTDGTSKVILIIDVTARQYDANMGKRVIVVGDQQFLLAERACREHRAERADVVAASFQLGEQAAMGPEGSTVETHHGQRRDEHLQRVPVACHAALRHATSSSAATTLDRLCRPDGATGSAFSRPGRG